jgi:putative oxidoreductase
MTAVIQLTIPEGWVNFHLPRAAMALALVVFGGGAVSLDHVIGREGCHNG